MTPLLLIRVGLMSTLVITSLVALVLRDRVADPAGGIEALQYAYYAQAAFVLVMLVVLRRMRTQPQHAARVVPITILAWAIAESLGVMGAVLVMLGGDLWFLIAGLMMYYVAGRTHPVSLR